ncbi:tetratricopeptide repeat protein [Dyadobacter flavalbus]|uniref:Tetratricopeptide repeat protein n=1 Tax=Dyadobacter flavalbus TaxID=2579942 RepID=A0A5M8Q9T5_9BACT|nr:tetratricopeptide repeat protein [Dyadobacter flavalbus]KAA6432747.1 tetratricopeptide repeat protein [Dyadobacter flavalbus]
MTVFILYVLLWLWDNRTFDSITKANERKLDAEQAYNNARFSESAKLYYQITYGSLFSEPAARLNLAHSYFKLGNYKLALKHYSLLHEIGNNTIASIANSQIALIKVIQKDTASALTSLKTALLLEPGNSLARSNYIILKKHFSGFQRPSDVTANQQKPQQQSTARHNSQTPPESKPENREVAEDVKKEELLKSLKAMNMSEDQARAILDAMKSNESQYIYQLRRKQYNKKNRQQQEIEW